MNTNDQEITAPLATQADDSAQEAGTEQRHPLLAALGERVRNLRAQRGLTRKAVAKAADVSERHLANLEYGTGNASILVLQQVAGALRAYEKLTLAALRIIKSRGTLVMASCSSRVTADAFFDTVTRTARLSFRPLEEIERSKHGIDHPIGFPEGAYLKALFAVVP